MFNGTSHLEAALETISSIHTPGSFSCEVNMTDQADANRPGESLRETISDGLMKAIREKNPDIKGASLILQDFVQGKTTSTIAATDIITVARQSNNVNSYVNGFNLQLQALARDYPFLQPQLVSLVVSITQLPRSSVPHALRSQFHPGIALSLMDAAEKTDLDALDASSSPNGLRDYIHLHALMARLLATLGEPQGPMEYLSRCGFALFLLSTFLERNLCSSFDLPNVHIPATAQHMIHAGKALFNQCNKGTGKDVGPDGPRWSIIRGELWTGPKGFRPERWDFWKSVGLRPSRGRKV
ncbi:MAG: hypothetical protein M1816_006367 [Peltula sp. TS41687]|nr:MAG: hypothetical protein M1816_006367 [Peltula sp. TS41687]